MVKFVGYKKAKQLFKQHGEDIRYWKGGDLTLSSGAYLAKNSINRWVLCGYSATGYDVNCYL